MSKSSLGINIESNFSDFYDSVASVESVGIYRRFTDTESRAKILGWLRKQGIKTIEIKAVRDFDNTDEQIVVYTNSTLHNSKGKSLMSLREARLMYPNMPASKFYTEANGETIKVLQVGSRRFKIILKQDNSSTLNEGEVVSITELVPQLNYEILEPIFSIDYVPDGVGMVAIDFNRVQKLDTLGIQNIMTPDEVVEEIKRALIAYNKF